MLEMSGAKGEELPRIKELWGLAFGDGDAFLDPFFQRFATLDETLLLREDGVAMAMLVLMPQTLAGGERAPYVYALTTHPSARGKGYAGMLLQYAAYRAREQGAAWISTVPAEESLHRFFAGEGYREGLLTWEGRFSRGELPEPRPGDRAEPISPAEYGTLREELLAGMEHVVYPPEQLALQGHISRMSGAGLYRLWTDGVPGCAALERLDGKRVLAKELLCPAGALGGGALAAAVLEAETYCLRAPTAWAGPGGRVFSFGMARPLAGPGGPPEREPNWYLGLAFD